MRINEVIEKAGYFWLPASPEKTFPGIVMISDGGVVESEIIGHFGNALNLCNDNKIIKRIVGKIEEFGDITLENCIFNSTHISSSGITKQKIRANRGFCGVSYGEGEIATFNTFQFSVEGIDEWVGISGISVENQYKNGTSIINYMPPKEIFINLDNGMKLLITFDWAFPSCPHVTEATVKQKTYFKLQSTEERDLDEYISVARNITTFLCFAIDEMVSLESVSATSGNIFRKFDNDVLMPIPIKIYYPSLPFSKNIPKIEFHRMLFTYGIIINFELILNNWIRAYDKIDPTLNLYFATKSGAQRFIDGRFLALAQALETYHRRTSNEKIMPEDCFNKLVYVLLENCPKENQEWLRGRLEHGNEISLRKRLKCIIKPFNNILGSSSEQNTIVNGIVDSRNYLTHYDPSLKQRALKGKELYKCCLKIEAFLQLNFLKVLGFTEEEISSILDNCPCLTNKLKM